jgi:hypothetical protein
MYIAMLNTSSVSPGRYAPVAVNSGLRPETLIGLCAFSVDRRVQPFSENDSGTARGIKMPQQQVKMIDFQSICSPT